MKLCVFSHFVLSEHQSFVLAMQQTLSPDITDPTPKLMPNYVIWLLNDDVHSVEYVFSVVKSVMKYTDEKTFKLVMQAHEEDQAAIWHGPLEVGELKRDQLVAGLPEFKASGEKVDIPLRVRLEPMP